MPFPSGSISASNNLEEPTGPTGIAPVPSTTAPMLSPTGQTTFGNAMTYGLPGIGVGLLDTIGQSLGVLHNDTIPNAIKAVTGDGENSFGDFYSRNQPTLRATGEIVGIGLPSLAAFKVLKSVKMAREAGTFGEALMNSSAMDVLLGNSADLTASEGAISNAAIEGKTAQGIWAGKSIATPAVNAARRGYYAARAVEAVRTTAAFELGNRLAFSSSSTFYPPDTTLADQLKWSGLGLAAGVGLDFVAAKYVTRNLIQAALKGYGKQAEEYGEVIPSVASTVGKDADKTVFRANQRGVGVTQYASMSDNLADMAKTNANPNFKTNVAQDQVNIKGVLNKQIGLMAYDNHPILPRTTLDQSQIDLAISALKKNNTALLFAKKLANVPENGAKEFYSGIEKIVTDARDEYNTSAFAASSVPDPLDQQKLITAANAKLAPIEAAASEMHYVLENDGRWTVYKNRADNFLDQNSFSDIKRSTYTTPNAGNAAGPALKNSKLTVTADNTIILHDNFRAEIPKGATPSDYSALYAAGSKLIKDWKPVEGQDFILTPQLPWRSIEGTLALADAHPEIVPSIKLGAGFSSLDDAAFHVLNEKFKEFNSLMPSTKAPVLTGIRSRLASLKENYTPAQVIQRLNLPEGTGLAPSPLIETFAHAKLQGMTDLNDMFPMKANSLTPSSYSQMDMLQQHLRETAGISDGSIDLPTQGVLLSQKDIKPVFVSAKSTPMMSRADAMVSAMVQAQRDVQLERMGMIKPTDSPLVSGVLAKVISQGSDAGELSGAANQVRAVQTLQDGILSGTGQIVYQDRINEQFATLKATQLLAQDTDNFTRNYVATLASKDLTPRIGQILHPKNKGDMLDFNRIEQSYRHGWEISGFEPSSDGKGVVARLSKDSKINQLLMEKHFGGSDIPDGAGEFMPDMSVTAMKGAGGANAATYTPMRVTKNSADFAKAISDMSKQSGREYNALRVALGSNPIKIRDFHLPTPELSNKDTWFVRNDAGNVIQTYGKNSYSTNQAQAQAAADLLNSTREIAGTQHVAVPLQMIQRDHAIGDENFFDLIDYTDQLAKTGAGIKGTGSQIGIDTTDQTLKSMVNSLQRQFLNVGIRARAAVFEPEINYAKQASIAAGPGSKTNLGGINIFDRYISTMFSQSPVTGKGTLGGIYNATENAMDRALSWMNAHYTELTGNESNVAAAKVMRTLLRKQSSEEEFAQFAKVLPSFNPLQDTAKWAESTFQQKPEWTTRPVMNKLSQVAATLQLRFLDAGMSIIHFANLATNMPSVVTALRKLPTESREQWLTRTAAWGSEIGNGIQTFSPLKAMNAVSRAYWKGELTEPMTAAAKAGYFEPEYAALTRVLTAPPSTKAGQYINTFYNGAVYLADHSEIMTRKLSWGMGYKIGKDLHGFTDEKNAYIFANNFVNDMNGNYSPNNKPAMFSGAIGQPLGVFQTYMTNFYRRLFGYVETQNKAAILAQYAAQAGVFGGKSTPGYSLWNSTFQSNESGSSDFTSRVNSRFAPGVGELILNGSLSNIPKIWGGLQADGFSWNTRGTADITELPPTIADYTRAAPIEFLAETFKGISATVNNIFSREGYSMQEQEEILAAFTTNRALKSIMEQASGVKTDQRLNVVQANTHDLIHVAAGLLGTTTASYQQITQASARERNVQLAQEDLRETLNMKTRAIFQSGNFDVSTLQAMVSDYTRSGGNPAYLGQWFRNNLMASMTPKAEATMQSLARSGKLLEFEDMLAAIQQNQTPNKTVH
jgi:hypothetical protein